MSFYDAIRVGASGAADFEIERSLRFNSADTAYLNRTPSSASNRKTWTWSSWVKREQASGGTDRFLFIAGMANGSDNIAHLSFDSNDRLRLYGITGSFDYKIRTNSVFRDFSAWYHVVVAFDTTQATASNRIKFYVNGVQLTDLGQSDYPSQNHDSYFNNTDLHNIGRYNGGSTQWFQGYMAEINFIDGLQLTPTSFGETNSDTGQWVPIDTSGLTFGTNGFRLKFADNSGTSATTLGKDSSGQGNNWTPNNFSVAAGEGNDSLEDTPTNNFCTMNPAVPSPSVTWANGNLDLAGTSSTEYSQNNTSTFGVSSGKWYVEVKFTNDGTTNTYVGICPISSSATTNMTGSVTDAAVLRMSNETYIEGSDTANIFPSGISSGNIIGIALDMDNQKLWFSLQGTYANSGNPATGANAIFSGITAGETMAICARPLSGTLNFNFGQRPFAYTPPTGFKKLNSANLSAPTILLPNKHFDTLLWSGNSTNNRSITGLEFKPDWVWIKKRSGGNMSHFLVRSLRAYTDNGGTGNNGSWGSGTNSTDSEQTTVDGGFVSFDANGFTLGKGSNNANADSAYQRNNASGGSYVGWNWNAGDTDGKTYVVKVVSDSGNKYRFDDFGTSAVTLDLAEGGTYIFNMDDSSNATHPFSIGTAANGTVYTSGITYFLDGVSKTYSQYTSGFSSASTRRLHITVPASAPQLYYWCSVHSGMGGAINTNSTLGSSNFDGGIQAVVKANPTAGFSMTQWTGTNGNGTVGHGLGVAPKMVIIRRRPSGSSWVVYHAEVGNTKRLTLDSSSSQSSASSNWFNNTSPTSTVIYLGSDGGSNGSTDPYVAWCFSEVSSYSKFGKYTGNASSDGTFVFTGFRPAWVLVKGSNFAGNWNLFDNKRPGSNVTNDRLFPNLSDAETDGSPSNNQIDILSNGFKLRGSNADTNNSGSTFIYLAFAESPFKNSRAR